MKTEKTSLSRIPWTDDAVAGKVLPFRLRLFYSKMKTETETLTVTFPKKFAKKLKHFAYLFAEEDNLGSTIQEQCEFVIDGMIAKREVLGDYPQLRDEADSRCWRDKSKVEKIADRIGRKINRQLVVRPSGHCEGAWGIIGVFTTPEGEEVEGHIYP